MGIYGFFDPQESLFVKRVKKKPMISGGASFGSPGIFHVFSVP